MRVSLRGWAIPEYQNGPLRIAKDGCWQRVLSAHPVNFKPLLLLNFKPLLTIIRETSMDLPSREPTAYLAFVKGRST